MYVPSFINIDWVVFELLITQIFTNYPLGGAFFLYFDEYLINYSSDFNEIFWKLFFYHFAHIFKVW